MSEEKKEGIVVNPLHHAGGTYRRPQADTAAATQGDAGNASGLSEQAAVDTSSQSSQTEATGTTASGASQPSSTAEPESFLQRVEGAVEDVVSRVEGAVDGVIAEVKEVVSGSAPTPAAAPAALGNVASGASTTTVVSDTSAQGSNGAGAPDMTTPTPSQVTQPPVIAPVVVAPIVTPPSTIVTGQVVNGSVVNATATPASAPAPAPAPKEESVVLPVIQTGITDVDRFVDDLMKDASLEAKIIINTIREYIVKMKPGKPVSVKEGVLQQVGFYNALLNAINNLEGDFRKTMQAILALLHAHKDGAFRETHIFRFIEHVPLSTDHRHGFRKITTLLKTLANPESRQELLRQINFEPITKYGLTERGRTKLAAFFGK
jgi:hypothetical protein